MHYIIGTRFSIVTPKVVFGQQQQTLRKERLLPSDRSYCLINILKKENGFEYKFVGNDNQTYTLEFNNCREADTFIAKHRNEVIPNYEIKETEIDQ